MAELDRVLHARGRAILLVSDFAALKESAAEVSWKLSRQYSIRMLGQSSTLTLWQKGKNASS
jgi:hypothetical protein